MFVYWCDTIAECDIWCIEWKGLIGRRLRKRERERELWTTSEEVGEVGQEYVNSQQDGVGGWIIFGCARWMSTHVLWSFTLKWQVKWFTHYNAFSTHNLFKPMGNSASETAQENKVSRRVPQLFYRHFRQYHRKSPHGATWLYMCCSKAQWICCRSTHF